MYAKRRWRPDRRFLLEQAIWAAGSLCLALAIWAFLNGPRLQAQQNRALAVQVAAEDQAVCARLGIPHGTQQYVSCASELDNVRRLQNERTEGDTEFFTDRSLQ